MSESRYTAFLSYSQAADGRLCEILQSRLQRFATPWYRRRSIRVFRDTTGLGATPDLWEAIRTALLSSEYLILLASERSAASPWVAQEVDAFLGARSADRLLIAWTDGELAWDRAAGDFDWSRTTCLPERLRGVFPAEPMHLDLRWARTARDLSPRRPEFVDAVARLSATLRQIPMDDLVGEDIRHYRATRRAAVSAVVALAVLLAGTAVAAVIAAQQRNRARAQQAVAEEQREESRRRLVRLTVTNGIRRLDEQDLSAAALWFADALDLETGEADRDLQRLRLRTALMRHPRLEQLWSTGRTSDRRTLGREVHFGRGDRYAVTYAWEGDLAFPGEGRSQVESVEPRVWDVQAGSRVSLGLEDGARVLAVDAAPDGLRVATADADGNVRLRAVAGGGDPVVLKHPCAVSDAGFSRDGRLLWTACDDRALRVWEASSGTPLAALAHSADVVFSWITADRTRLLSGTADDRAHVWTLDADGRARAHVEIPHEAPLQQIDVGLNGGRALTLAGYSARLWDMGGPGPKVLDTWLDVNHVEVAPDGDHAVLATGSGSVVVIDLDSGAEVFTVQHDDVVFDAAFSPDGRRLATASRDGTARIWSGRDGRLLAAPLHHEGPVSDVDFASSGTKLVTITRGETVRTWDLDGQAGHPHRYVKHAQFLPDGSRVMTAGDFDAKVWDVSSWKSLTLTPRSQLYQASISPDGRLVATATEDGSVRIWNAVTGEEIRRLPHGRRARQAVFSPDGRTLASAGQVGGRHDVILWDPAAGTKSATLPHAGSYITDVFFSPDGRRLLTLASRELRVWEVASRTEIAALRADAVTHAVYDPTGTRIAYASSDVHVVDAGTGRPLSPVVHQDNFRMSALSFAGGGTLVVIATESGAVRVWDSHTGQPVTPPFGHGRGTVVRHLAVRGDLLATSASDGSVRIWNVRTGQAVTPAMSHPGVVSAVWSADGRRLVTVGDDAVREWGLSAEAYPGSDAELHRLAQLLSSRRIDATGAVSSLSADEVRALWAARTGR